MKHRICIEISDGLIFNLAVIIMAMVLGLWCMWIIDWWLNYKTNLTDLRHVHNDQCELRN